MSPFKHDWLYSIFDKLMRNLWFHTKISFIYKSGSEQAFKNRKVRMDWANALRRVNDSAFGQIYVLKNFPLVYISIFNYHLQK